MTAQLPDYFIADLPAEADLTPRTITEACQTLKRNARQYLDDRPTPHIIRALASVAENWLQEAYPIRRLALERGPEVTGFPITTLTKGLDSFFKEITETNLKGLIQQDLGHVDRLDRPSSSDPERRSSRFSLASGPELLVHITGGMLPNPVFTSMILGLLARSAQFVKCARGTSFLVRLFAHSIYDMEPKLGACLEVAEWTGGTRELECPLFAEADCVTAMGSDATIASIHRSLPPGIRFLPYGHRVSFGFITGKRMREIGAVTLAERVVDDMVEWNQLGCLSPHVIYLEKGSDPHPETFAAHVARALERREGREPRGELPLATAAQLRSRRSFYQVRAAHSAETACWLSENSTSWSVVFEEDPQFQLSCLNRFIYLKPVANLAEAVRAAEPVRGNVSTVGLEATPSELSGMVQLLARWGVRRICPMGRMQAPHLLWRHDGRPSLADLVTWTDWEL